jgi:hypothetical protein
LLLLAVAVAVWTWVAEAVVVPLLKARLLPKLVPIP